MKIINKIIVSLIYLVLSSYTTIGGTIIQTNSVIYTGSNNFNGASSLVLTTNAPSSGQAAISDGAGRFYAGTINGARDFTWNLALGNPATVGTNKTNILIVPHNGRIINAFACAKTSPTGTNLLFDINLNGTTIWTTQENRLSIPASTNFNTQTNFDTTNLTESDLLTIDIDQIGSIVAGQDITIVLHCLLSSQ